jgi:hypothetical protein
MYNEQSLAALLRLIQICFRVAIPGITALMEGRQRLLLVVADCLSLNFPCHNNAVEVKVEELLDSVFFSDSCTEN